MRALIDTIFNPVFLMLSTVRDYLLSLTVPLSQPIDLGRYFGHFNILGPTWVTLITTICALTFIYLIAYVIINNIGLLIKFKNLIKWW